MGSRISSIPPGGSSTVSTAPSTGSGNPQAQAGYGTPKNQATAVQNGALNGTITPATINGVPPPPPAPENLKDAGGRRVRLRPKPNAMSQILGNSGNGSGLMSPLYLTNGVVFPYQPTVTWSQDVNYTQMEIVHANQDFYSYSKTPALKLSVEGDFSVQNQKEGRYALACIHFLRTVSKMWFGGSKASADLAGTPPPVLLFDAYGQYMFNALPVIVTNFSVTLPKDVDYVAVETAYNANNLMNSNPTQSFDPAVAATAFNNILNPVAANSQSQGFAWLPALFSVSVQLTVQNTPQRLRAFDLDTFRTGQLLQDGTWI